MTKKLTALLLLLALVLTMTGCSDKAARATYDDAVELFEEGSYSSALRLFNEIPDYKDSDDYIRICNYYTAMLTLSPDSSLEDGYSGNVVECTSSNADAYAKAVSLLEEAGGYKDSDRMLRDASKVLNAYNEATKYQRIASTIGDKFLGYLKTCEYDGSTFNLYLSESYPVTYEVLLRGRTEPEVAESWGIVRGMFTETIFEYLPNALINIIDSNGTTIGTYIRGADNEHATIIYDATQG